MKKFLMLFLAFWLGRRVERYGPAVAKRLGRVTGNYVGGKIADILRTDMHKRRPGPVPFHRVPEVESIEIENLDDTLRLMAAFEQYVKVHGRVSISDLYGLTGVYPETFQYGRAIYGWTDPKALSFKRVGIKRPVWVSELPDPVHLSMPRRRA